MKKQMIALFMLAVFGLSRSLAAPASVTRDDQREVMVTIYNGNLGLVKDLRETRLPAGVSEVQFMDVAAMIVRPPCISSRSPMRPGSRSSSRTTSTTC